VDQLPICCSVCTRFADERRHRPPPTPVSRASRG
jgi:hypothetical protein